MRVLKRNPWLTGLAVLLALLAFSAGRARADATTDRAGSIVIFPKIIADGTRDTIIKLSNQSNMVVIADCNYVNGAGSCEFSGSLCGFNGDCDEGERCRIQWSRTDFQVILTRQQPTIWRASTGRIAEGGQESPDIHCHEEVIEGSLRQRCPGFFLVGNVPPLVPPFRGELKCVEVSVSGEPIASNALKGEAIIQTVGETFGPQEISEYNSINLLGDSQQLNADAILELGREYNGCPERLAFNHYEPDGADPIANGVAPVACTGGCPVTTELTLLPCTQDFGIAEVGTQVSVQIRVTDEFESVFTGSTVVDCWMNLSLSDISPAFAGNSPFTFRKSVLFPQSGGRCRRDPATGGGAANVNTQCTVGNDAPCGGGVCEPASGLLAVVEEFHRNDTQTVSSAAVNVHMIGERPGDTITLP